VRSATSLIVSRGPSWSKASITARAGDDVARGIDGTRQGGQVVAVEVFTHA